MKNGLIINEYGDKCWYKDDQYHREDDPAIEWSDGSKYWYLNGELHRENGPAEEFANGSKYWWYHGQYIGDSYTGMTNEQFLKLIRLKSFW